MDLAVSALHERPYSHAQPRLTPILKRSPPRVPRPTFIALPRCFDSFLTYKRDVMTGLEKWNKDASLYCKVSDMGNKYASHEENNVWRSEHLADEDVKFRNIALEDTRRGYDGAEKKEWCGSAASHGPSTRVMLLVCVTASIALLRRR